MALSDRMRDSDRESAESGRGRKLRDGRIVARSDQTTRKRAGKVAMKISNIMTTAGEWLRGEGPHHQIVISSRVRLARKLAQPRFSGLGEKGRAQFEFWN